MTTRQAIVTFDPDRVAQWDTQAEDCALAWILKQALAGKDYARERGILSIDLIDENAPRMVPVPRMRLGRIGG